MAKRLLEKYVQVVRMDGINTNKDVTIGVNGAVADLSVSGDLTVGGSINFAATTFDDPVTFDSTAEFNSTAQFDGPVVIDTNSLFQLNSANLDIRGQSQNNQPISGGLNGAYNATGFNRIYSALVNNNSTVTLQNETQLDGMSVTFVLESIGGGQTVDFTGNLVSEGTLSMGAGAGDVFSITFISNGTKWVEVNRSGPQI